MNLLFTDANDLAESISRSDDLGVAARTLMNSDEEHVYKGIGFYLEGGAFVEEHHNRMFVGWLENQDESLERLAATLNVTNHVAKNARKNKHVKAPLSRLAIQNLKTFYETDYAALRALAATGLIPTDLYGIDSHPPVDSQPKE
jgi:hypothetical protein